MDKYKGMTELEKEKWQRLDYLRQKVREDNTDDKFVRDAVIEDTFCFQWASEKLKDDKDLVLFLVKRCGAELAYVSDRLKDDADVVNAAVNEWGMAIKWASNRLKEQLQ